MSSVFEVELSDETVALGILSYFLDLANKRGAFSLQESARILEALNYCNAKVKASTDDAAKE